MTQMLIRNLESQLKTRLQRRAQSHGRRMEEEAMEILRSVLRQEETPVIGLGTEIAALFRCIGLRDGEEIPEIRGQLAAPIKTTRMNSSRAKS
jgi:plasmid stability protein